MERRRRCNFKENGQLVKFPVCCSVYLCAAKKKAIPLSGLHHFISFDPLLSLCCVSPKFSYFVFSVIQPSSFLLCFCFNCNYCLSLNHFSLFLKLHHPASLVVQPYFPRYICTGVRVFVCMCSTFPFMLTRVWWWWCCRRPRHGCWFWVEVPAAGLQLLPLRC